MGFDSNEPRNPDGTWGSGGGGHASKSTSSGGEAAGQMHFTQKKASRKAMAKAEEKRRFEAEVMAKVKKNLAGRAHEASSSRSEAAQSMAARQIHQAQQRGQDFSRGYGNR